MKTSVKRKLVGGMCFLVAAACWTLVALPAAEADVTPLSPHEAGAILGAGNEACSDDACN